VSMMRSMAAVLLGGSTCRFNTPRMGVPHQAIKEFVAA